MRAGRPRSRGCRPDGEVGVVRRATSLKAGLSPLGNSRLPASRAPAPHDGADHPRVKQVLFQVSSAPATTTLRITQRENSRSSMKTCNQTRIGTRTDGPPSTTTGAKMLLHFCPVGVTLSWEEAPPGARASRPHKSSRSFSHLLHRNQPAAAPCLSLRPGPWGSRPQGGSPAASP